MASRLKKLLMFFLVILTPVSVNQWSVLPVSNTTLNWVLYAFMLLVFLNGRKYFYNKNNENDFFFIKIYTFWVFICCLRGLIVSEYYWDYKSLMNAGFALIMVVSVYVFSNPYVVQYVLTGWLRFAMPLFLFFIFFISSESYGYYLIIISFLSLFLPAIDLRWKIILVSISLFVIFVDFDARSNVIKFTLPIFFSLLLYFKKTIKSNAFKIINILLLTLPVFLFLLGASGLFNVLKIDDYIAGEYSQKKVVAGEFREVNLKVDTRTFIYEEVISSAIKNHYLIFGRTPARGYDSKYFGEHAAEELGTGRYERYNNEVSILNIFTWTGILGVVLYFFVFIKASFLAIYKSNNSFIKVLGLYVSFRWTYAWVEDFNRFDIMNITLWIIISLCYSIQFRSMTDLEFKRWLGGVFSKKGSLSYRLR